MNEGRNDGTTDSASNRIESNVTDSAKQSKTKQNKAKHKHIIPKKHLNTYSSNIKLDNIYSFIRSFVRSFVRSFQMDGEQTHVCAVCRERRNDDGPPKPELRQQGASAWAGERDGARVSKETALFVRIVELVYASEKRKREGKRSRTRGEKTRNAATVTNLNGLHYYMTQLVCNVQKYCVHRRSRACTVDMQRNGFISADKKHMMAWIFNKAQRHYAALEKFKFFMNHRRRVNGPIIDLEFNAIEPERRVRVYQDNTAYTFSARDVTRIVTNALTFIDSSVDLYFFPSASMPKNPYTNAEFSKSILFEVFYQLKKMPSYRLPLLLECFFRSFFSLPTFDLLYGNTLRRCQLDRYIRDMSNASLRVYGENMLLYLYQTGAMDEPVHIKESFPTDEFVFHMRPFVTHYIRFIHTFNVMESETHRGKMFDGVLPFLERYPRFGRKVVTRRSYVHNHCRNALNLGPPQSRRSDVDGASGDDV